jgi:hypothetical protein
MPDEVDTPMTENINPEHELRREVLARFGLAMYRAQMLEFSIVNQLLALGATDGTYNTYKETEAAVVGLLRATLGQLNQRLADSEIDLTDLADDLKRALDLRNFLAHNYFRERLLAAELPAGRERMLDELAQAASFLQEMGERLNTLTTKIYEAQGITPVDLRDVRETAERIVPGRPLPGLSDEPPPIVVTEDGYVVGNGSVTRARLAREQGRYVHPTIVIGIEWEKATDDERARLLSLAERLDMDEQPEPPSEALRSNADPARRRVTHCCAELVQRSLVATRNRVASSWGTDHQG